VLTLTLLVVSVIPLLAQPAEPRAGVAIITGTIEYVDGQLIVDGYVIYPAADFVADDFPEGTPVIIVGTLNDDGSVAALAVEPFSDDLDDVCDPAVEDCDPDVCDPAVDTCEPVICDPAIEDCDVEVCDPETEDCDTEEDPSEDYQYGACGMEVHPAGMKISEAYGTAYEDVMELFCSGYGFGEIMIALKLADGDEEFFDELIEMRDSGKGWGLVKKYAYANKPVDDDEDGDEGDDTGETDDSLTLAPGPLSRGQNANANAAGGPPENPGNSGNNSNNSNNGNNGNNGNSDNNGNNSGRPSSPGNSGNAGKGGKK
jgi:hypothetical protein